MSKAMISAIVVGMAAAAGVSTVPGLCWCGRIAGSGPRAPSSRCLLVRALRLPPRQLRLPQGITIDLRSWLRSAQFRSDSTVLLSWTGSGLCAILVRC